MENETRVFLLYQKSKNVVAWHAWFNFPYLCCNGHYDDDAETIFGAALVCVRISVRGGVCAKAGGVLDIHYSYVSTSMNYNETMHIGD